MLDNNPESGPSVDEVYEEFKLTILRTTFSNNSYPSIQSIDSEFTIGYIDENE
jgi:hypothetical protein